MSQNIVFKELNNEILLEKSGYHNGMQRDSVIQVFVFRGEEYLGWDCFIKNTVVIGSGKNADVLLNEKSIANIHAQASIKKDQLIVTNKASVNGVCVNRKEIDSSIIGPLDSIGIGPYTLKMRINKMVSPVDEDSHESKREALSSPAPINVNDDDLLIIDEGQDHSDWIHGDAQKIDEYSPNGAPIKEEPDRATKETLPSSEVKEKATLKRTCSQPLPSLICIEEEEEDDDEEVDEDFFFLKEKVLTGSEKWDIGHGTGNLLEVVKYKARNIVDVCFLNEKEKYYFSNENGRFCLAEYKNSQDFFIYFNDQLKGFIRHGNEAPIETEALHTEENLYRKKKSIYRYLLPKNGAVTLGDGYNEYRIRIIPRSESPRIETPPKEKNPIFKNLLKSSAFHFVMLILIGFFVRLPDTKIAPAPESRFVTIDTRELAQKTNPVKPKTEPVQKKIEPAVRPQEQIPPKQEMKQKQETKQQMAARADVKQSRSAPPANAGQTFTSVNAGGGSGKSDANVSNRDVKQAGILGALGLADGIGIMPTEAIAAVTNLDAVHSVNAANANFKVGGVVGKLETKKISVPTGGVVTTKGSTQLMRSAGIEGKGAIAALEKGKTGENQVMALVSANLDKRVSVQGGMSREEVKKVIDQHLDEVSYCYESALVANPSLMGKVVFEWKIKASGKTGEVGIKNSTLHSDAIHACIKQAIQTWQFPKPDGSEVIVSYPFIFDIVGF